MDKGGKVMDKLISLQAAIDAVRDRMGKGETKIGDTFIECFEMILNALPSAQPYTDAEIQTMQDLEQAQFDKMYELGKQATQEDLQPTCNNLATDCISRQDVLNWLNDEWDGMVLSVFDGIRNLPSAQPEIIRCCQCKYAEVADPEDSQDGYTCQFHRGSIWFSGSYCSWGEKKNEI